ncbi:MAG: translocation/assembly module TamB, partial [Gammaproteobacteria bacterium]
MSDTRQETQAEREPRKKSRWYRALFWLLALVVLVPVLLVSAVLLALRSETGTAWVLEQVPGLDVSQGQGSLFGEWRAEQLRWHGYGVRVEVVSPYIDWSPSCLFQKQLCLESLRADSLAVQTQPSGAPESDQQGIDLPDLNLPLALRVSNVELGELVLNGAAIWDSFSLSAQGSGADWQLDHASYQRDELGVSASGRVETRRDWPVELNVSANLPPPVGNDWNIDLNLGGSIHDLRLSGHSQGYLEATFSGKTSPLDPQLPAELRITSERFLAHDSLPATLELRNWTVNAKGSLEAGFRTRGNATLPGTEGPVDLSIQGLVTTSSARDVVLSLMEQTPDSDPGKMTLNGRITWQDGLEAGVDLSLRAFPWFTLLPDVDAPPVVLEKLNGTASWSAGNYHANLDAEVSGPQGPATLSTVIDGDLERTRLTDLSVTTGAGTMEGRGSVDFSGPLSWQAGLTLDEFNPGYWVPLLEAQLSGAVETRGSLGDGPVPDMSAAWDLSGQWRQKPAHAEGKLDASSGQWMLSDLSVSVGDNRLAGKGTFGDNLSGDVSVELPSPGDLLAGLSGNINGNASISGTLEQPLGSLNLQGQGLGWQNRVEAGQLEVTADLKPGLRLVSRLQAENIEAGGQQLESLSLAVEGTQQQNALSLTAVHQDALLELALGGGFGAGWQSWNGRLARGMIDVPAQNQRWDLEAPASLDYQAGGKFLFGAHCWRWNESSVCAGDQTLLPDPSIAYRISHFPTEALAPLLPETLKWKAWIDGDIEIAMTPDGPDGRLRLDAGKGDFRVLTDGEWQKLQHDALSAQLVLKPRNADLGVQLAGPDIGELSIDLTVDPQSPEKNVDGRFRLEGFDFSLIGQLAGLQEVAGDISGEGTITGPLMKPAIEGQIALSGGRVVDHRLPIPIEEAVASIDLNGYSADLSARIQSNARSQTILDGTFDWRDKPKARIRVSGNRVPFSLEPYARVELAPDLIIELADSDLSVSG